MFLILEKLHIHSRYFFALLLYCEYSNFEYNASSFTVSVLIILDILDATT